MPQFYPKQSLYQFDSNPRGIIKSPRENLMQILTRLGLTTNLKLCFDFGAAATYPGSGQTIGDLSGNANDFILGSNTSVQSGIDPTFFGTANSMATAYFERSGTGSYLLYGAGSNDPWMRDFAKAGKAFTIMLVVSVNSDAGSPIMSTAGNPATGNGFAVIYNSSANKAITLFTEQSGGGTIQTPVGQAAWSSWPRTVMQAFVATNHNSGNTVVSFVNNTLASQAWPGTVSSGNAINTFKMFTWGDGVTTAANNVIDLHQVAIWSGTALTNTNLSDIYSNLTSRYSFN